MKDGKIQQNRSYKTNTITDVRTHTKHYRSRENTYFERMYRYL